MGHGIETTISLALDRLQVELDDEINDILEDSMGQNMMVQQIASQIAKPIKNEVIKAKKAILENIFSYIPWPLRAKMNLVCVIMPVMVAGVLAKCYFAYMSDPPEQPGSADETTRLLQEVFGVNVTANATSLEG